MNFSCLATLICWFMTKNVEILFVELFLFMQMHLFKDISENL